MSEYIIVTSIIILTTILAYVDYIPVEGNFVLTNEDFMNCLQIEIVRNGIATGTIDKNFQFNMWYYMDTDYENWVSKTCQISIKNTDSKWCAFQYGANMS